MCFCCAASAEDFFVDLDGKGNLGDGARTFTSLQQAVNEVPSGTAESPNRILLFPGKYEQQLIIPKKSHLALIGKETDPQKTMVTFKLNATSEKVEGGTVGTTGSSSTFVSANNFTAANITFANDTPYGVAQAVAIKTQGDEIAFMNCRFEGFQDTLYVTGGRDYFLDCTITGSVDFIFGNATALFENCTINSSHPGAVTAANTAASTPVGLVFKKCKLTCENPGAAAKSVHLGRPWQYDRGSYASTFFLDCEVGPHIAANGWNPWDKTNDHPEGDTRYGQFGLKDLDGKPLNTNGYVKWSHTLTASQAERFMPERIFGPASHWSDAEWGIGGSLFGPVNAAGKSNVTTPISAKAYSDWKLGGTWEPRLQIERAHAR
jgi:pectinesterase